MGVYEVVQELGSKNMVKTLGLSKVIEAKVAVYLVEIFYLGVLWGPLPPDAASRRGQPYTGAGHLTNSKYYIGVLPRTDGGTRSPNP